MIIYTDPKTGKTYLAARSGAAAESIFIDPETGKTYIRTKSGRIIEKEAPEKMEGDLWIDPATGKMYIRTKSGRLLDPPDGAEVIKGCY